MGEGRLSTVPGRPVDLVTEVDFASFELIARWAVSPGGNSGLIYRVTESEHPAWTSGAEYQIVDDERHPDGLDPRTSTASLYGLLPPSADRILHPAGEMNESRVVVVGSCVEHWLNGVPVLRYRWDEPELRRLIGRSKFRDWPSFMAAESGSIVLQHHGELVSFTWVEVRQRADGGADARCSGA